MDVKSEENAFRYLYGIFLFCFTNKSILTIVNTLYRNHMMCFRYIFMLGANKCNKVVLGQESHPHDKCMEIDFQVKLSQFQSLL